MTGAVLEFKNVSYKYPGSEDWVLKDVNLRIPQNSFYVLAGPTGCGKTTFLTLARGFHKEYGGQFRGDIYVLGENIKDFEISELGTKIGIIFQDPACQIHQLRVVDEIRSGPMYQGLRWEECIERAKKAMTKILGKEFSRRTPTEISAGEQQKVALAALIAMQCDILLLDEPFSFIDIKSSQTILRILLELKSEGKTIILATHNLEQVARYADGIALLSAGKIVLECSTKDVLYSEKLEDILPPPLSVRVAKILMSKGILNEKIVDWQELVEKVHPSLKSLRKSASKNEPKGISLEVNNISYIYPNENIGVKNASLEVYKGEILGLVGANGSGKTTLAKLILRLLKSSKGSIRFLGEEITRLKTSDIAKRIGYIAQNPNEMLFESTVFKECGFGPFSLGLKNPEEKIKSTLSKLGLLKYADKHPDSLSGGEKRLLTIGDILVNEPQVLILDEPEFGLDSKAWRSIAKIITDLKNEGKTIILITHNLEITLFLCDRIALMKQGEVIKIGKPMEIYSDTELLEAAGLTNLPVFKAFSSVINEYGDLPGEDESVVALARTLER